MPIAMQNNSESVLVTGATGFIGQLLVKQLLADGHKVSVLTRDPQKAAAMFNGKVTCIQSMAALPQNVVIDTIINLAGARILGWRWSEKRKAVLMQSRVALTQQLVDWIAKAEHKPALLLSASAIGYYGIQAIGDDTGLTEESPSQNIFMAQLCREWEAAAQQAQAFGVKVVAMRFGLVLGQQGALPMMLLPIKLGLGGKLATGKQWMSWVHIDDLLRGIKHLWQLSKAPSPAKLESVYNFTAPEAVSQWQFTQIAAQLLHRPCIFPTPAGPMRLLLGEQADLLLEGQRVLPKHLLESGFSFQFPSLQTALAQCLSKT